MNKLIHIYLFTLCCIATSINLYAGSSSADEKIAELQQINQDTINSIEAQKAGLQEQITRLQGNLKMVADSMAQVSGFKDQFNRFKSSIDGYTRMPGEYANIARARIQQIDAQASSVTSSALASAQAAYNSALNALSPIQNKINELNGWLGWYNRLPDIDWPQNPSKTREAIVAGAKATELSINNTALSTAKNVLSNAANLVNTEIQKVQNTKDQILGAKAPIYPTIARFECIGNVLASMPNKNTTTQALFNDATVMLTTLSTLLQTQIASLNSMLTDLSNAANDLR